MNARLENFPGTPPYRLSCGGRMVEDSEGFPVAVMPFADANLLMTEASQKWREWALAEIMRANAAWFNLPELLDVVC